MWYNMCERLLDLSIIAFKPFNFREIAIFRSLAARQPTWKLVDGLKSLFQSLHPDPSPGVHMRSYLTISLRVEPLVTRSWARLPVRTICGRRSKVTRFSATDKDPGTKVHYLLPGAAEHVVLSVYVN